MKPGMTKKQVEASRLYDEFLRRTLADSETLAEILGNAIVKLPGTNEKGEAVTHGCNMVMYNARLSLQHMANDLLFKRGIRDKKELDNYSESVIVSAE